MNITLDLGGNNGLGHHRGCIRTTDPRIAFSGLMDHSGPLRWSNPGSEVSVPHLGPPSLPGWFMAEKQVWGLSLSLHSLQAAANHPTARQQPSVTPVTIVTSPVLTLSTPPMLHCSFIYHRGNCLSRIPVPEWGCDLAGLCQVQGEWKPHTPFNKFHTDKQTAVMCDNSI